VAVTKQFLKTEKYVQLKLC